MKTKEELNALKEKEIKAERRELTDEELEQVSGGEEHPHDSSIQPIYVTDGNCSNARVLNGKCAPLGPRIASKCIGCKYL